MGRKQVHCPICDLDMAAGGAWAGHVRSKVHKAALGTRGLAEVEPIELDATEPPSEQQVRKQYEDRITELEEALERERPDKDAPLYTAENVESVVGREKLREAAELQLVARDRSRRAQGLKPLWDSPDELEPFVDEEIEKLKIELVEQQTSWARTEGSGTRTMKMIRPDGVMVQIGVENQVNNGAAGPGVNIYKMRDKGFKPAVPYRCELHDCWAAASYPQGSPKFCSPGHASLIPQALKSDRQVAITPGAAEKGYTLA